MVSPSDHTDACRDPDTDTEKPSLIEESSVGQETLSVENANSLANKALNLESTQEATQNLQDPEESDGRDQQPEALIEESKDEEDDMDATQAASSSFYLRGGGPKRKKRIQKKLKQQEKSKEKLDVLLKTLKPIAFVPGKILDFSRHEKLLKTLGLWDFLHLDFNQNIRQDLVAKLVAYYNPESRSSNVNGARIKVSRADLARALKLPKKKDVVIPEEEREHLENDESIRFMEEVLSTWILLQRDDMWIMPSEVVEWHRCIKQKQVEKLDWPAMLWFMVEKELKAEPPLSDCYFASHLQLLIKTQKEDLLREKSEVDEDDVVDGDADDGKEVDFLEKSPIEDCLEVNEKDVGAADLRLGDGATDSKEEKYVEEHMIELNLGQETVSEMVSEEEQGHAEGEPMDVEENKKEEDEKCLWNEDSHAGSHFLRRCDRNNAGEGDEENKTEGLTEMGEDEPVDGVGEEETEDENEKHEGGFPFFPNGDSLPGVAQENLLLGDASHLGYGSGLQIHGDSTGGEFLASRVDMHMAMGSGSSSLFGNGNNKREIDHENDTSYHSDNPGNKRLRTEEPTWDEKQPSVEICLDQLEFWLEKSRLSCAEKERERGQSVMNQQYLMNELQNKAEMIQDLERTKFEELHRKDLMIYKLESELRMMTSVVEGYRKALKEAQKASKEHRKRCPLRDDKPVYKDVKGSGGLVLSTGEIEKLRLKQEEEDRMTQALIERQIEEFGSGWLKLLKRHMEAVEIQNERLIEVENEMKILREEKSKNLESPEVAAAAATEET